MDTLFAIIVIGSILIAIAGCALYFFSDLQKQSLAKMADERALIARRQQAISQQEQEEKLAQSMEASNQAIAARKQAVAARRIRRAARMAAQQPLLESQNENIASGGPKANIVSD